MTGNKLKNENISITEYLDNERMRRKKIGFYTSMEELQDMEYIDSNLDLLRCTSSMFFDLIQDIFSVEDSQDSGVFQDLSERYRPIYRSLEEKRKLGEKKKGTTFSSTTLFKRFEFEQEQKTIVLLLFGAKGLGTNTTFPILTGEFIVQVLKILHDTPLDKAWKLISYNSDLYRFDMITRFIREGDGSVEDSSYKIPEKVIGQLLDYDEEVEKVMINDYIRENDMRDDKRLQNFLEKTRGDLKDFKDDEPGDKKLELSRIFKAYAEPEEEEDKEIDLGPLKRITSNVKIGKDVVLPEDMIKDIKGVLAQKEHIDKFQSWGMDAITGGRTGISMLFTGRSGTGKTMTASAIGEYLGKDVYFISFPKLLSKWYSETERNVSELFTKINELDCVVVVDEADGLLHNRFEPRDSVDVTENRLVTIFLQEIEKSSGVIILTTNYSTVIDGAFERRLDLKQEFPMPGVDAREKIWWNHIPEELPLGDDVDIEELVKRYEFSGGQIKNSVVNAVRYALSRDADEVTQKDFVKACEREERGKEAMNYDMFKDSGKDVKGYS